MKDLEDEKDVLIFYEQRNIIYTQLKALRGAYLVSAVRTLRVPIMQTCFKARSDDVQGYADLIASRVEDSDYREEIDEIVTDGLGLIDDAVEEFEPDDKTL